MFHQCSIKFWSVRKEESLQVVDLQGFALEGARTAHNICFLLQ